LQEKFVSIYWQWVGIVAGLTHNVAADWFLLCGKLKKSYMPLTHRLDP
jgi:hypothetical protein